MYRVKKKLAAGAQRSVVSRVHRSLIPTASYSPRWGVEAHIGYPSVDINHDLPKEQAQGPGHSRGTPRGEYAAYGSIYHNLLGYHSYYSSSYTWTSNGVHHMGSPYPLGTRCIYLLHDSRPNVPCNPCLHILWYHPREWLFPSRFLFSLS